MVVALDSAPYLLKNERIELTDNRSDNERNILNLIRQHKALPKATLSKLTGLSAQSATVIIKKLEASGLVKSLAPIKGGIGQPKIPFGLNPEGAFGIGLKVGRRNYEMTLVDLKGTVRASRYESVSYPTTAGFLTFASNAFHDIVKSLNDLQRQRIRGVGVAMPFAIWNWPIETGASESTLAQWQQFDIKSELECVLSLPVFVKNDTASACSAEMTFGNPQQWENYLYVFVGTFLGGAVVINNSLLSGRTGNAGAIGSLPFFEGQEQKQLINQSSLYLLEQSLNTNGEEGKKVYDSTSPWHFHEASIVEWVNGAARGLAHATQCAMSLLDLDGVIVDGAIPPEIKESLLVQTQEAMFALDMRGIASTSICSGTVGANAQSIGSAILPLLANYY